nr:hypothetical protein [Tanacetum cinerariifolium]
ERSDSLDDNIISGLLPFSAITPDEPVLSTEELDNSLSMGDEHLDTIPATKSDEFIKSSVENLIPIPSESEGIPDHRCDVPSHDNSPPLDISKDQFEDFSESNEEFSSTDNDSFSFDKIDYVEASPLDSELVSSEVMEIVIRKGSRCVFPTFPIVLRPFKTLCFFNYALILRQDYDITSSLRRGALHARASNTIYVDTARTPLNTASTPTIQDDYQIPSLEDIYEVLRDGIFTSASYDDEGAMADFTNLETTVNVSPIPTSRIYSIHPITQILRDPTSAVQTRSKVNKSSRAHAFIKVGLMLCRKSCYNSRFKKFGFWLTCLLERRGALHVLEKIVSKPLSEEEIIPMKLDQHPDNAESDLMESLHTHDSFLLISSKIDSL